MLRVSSGMIPTATTEADLPWLLSAVAAHLALYKFTLKTSPPSRFNPNSKEPLSEKLDFSPLQRTEEWDRGVVYAQAQNLARTVCFFFLPSSHQF